MPIRLAVCGIPGRTCERPDMSTRAFGSADSLGIDEGRHISVMMVVDANFQASGRISLSEKERSHIGHQLQEGLFIRVWTG